jgi:hypothetical protein
LTEAELERVNACFLKLGLRPLRVARRTARDAERLQRIAAAERAVAADGQPIRREAIGAVLRVH